MSQQRAKKLAIFEICAVTYKGNPKKRSKEGRSLVLSELGASTEAPSASRVGEPQSFSDMSRPGIKDTSVY
jgi:hypothetical protein